MDTKYEVNESKKEGKGFNNDTTLMILIRGREREREEPNC